MLIARSITFCTAKSCLVSLGTRSHELRFWTKWVPRRIKHNAFVLSLWACVWLLGTYPLGRPLSEGWPTFAPLAADDVDYAEAWRQLASEAGIPAFTQQQIYISFDDFTAAIGCTGGSPGLDGWTASEVKWLLAYCPQLIRELYDLLLASLQSPETIPRDDPAWRTFFSWRLAAVPKRDSEDMRPIAVGSILLRAFQRVVLSLLPDLPEGQWGGRKHVSVVHAVLNWWAHPGSQGAELDLSKAFDTVQWPAAAAALLHAGTHPAVVGFLRRVWAGSRFCSFSGSLSRPFFPTRGIPQGDPTSPNVLAQLLRPWHSLLHIHCPRVSAWAFLDDRSLRSSGGPAALTAALDITARCDSALGLVENRRKRQLWSNRGSVEHLGLRLNPNLNCLPTLRGDWLQILDLIAYLPRVPGGFFLREAAARMFVKPLWQWPLPLLALPPPELTHKLRHALLCSTCTWWCRARFFADREDLHPQFGSAVTALSRASALPRSQRLDGCIHAYADVLGLQPVIQDGAPVFLALAGDPIAARLLDSFLVRRGRRAGVDPGSEQGRHALRLLARLRCLEQVSQTRYDCEGLLHADLHILSDSKWQAWVASLQADQRLYLRIYRGGAVTSPTRRAHRPGETGICDLCGQEQASFRHYWAFCRHFHVHRQQLCERFSLDLDWFQAQPRCTAKSGWVTFSAAATAARRVDLQIATSILGIAIIQSTWRGNPRLGLGLG